ncbi:MAG: hypothetical protein LQ351_006184 [Letrouitia transgressa]|nr:MAG: hypothetical protein LQ351_006184 [Letrouitia transgressa]
MRYSSAVVAVAATLASGSSAAALSGGAPSATDGAPSATFAAPTVPSATGGAPAATGTGDSVPSNTFGGNEPSKTLGATFPTGTGIDKDSDRFHFRGPHIPIWDEPLKPECDMFKPYVAKVLLKKVCKLHLTPLPPGETGFSYHLREGYKGQHGDATTGGASEPTGSAFGGAPSATSTGGPASFTLDDPAPSATGTT